MTTIFSLSGEIAYAQAPLEGDVSGCKNEQYVDWLKTGVVNAMILDCSFSTEQDRIIILPRREAPNPALGLLGNLNSEDAIWLFDAASDSSANLIIEFNTSADGLQARIFDDINNDGEVSYSIIGGQLRIIESNNPAIQVTALDGTWRSRNGLSPNLDIIVDGPVDALAGYHRFLDRLKTDGNADFLIRVRDTDGDGYPDYDFRRDVSHLPKDWGLRRVNLSVNLRGALSPVTGYILWPLLGTIYGEPLIDGGELVFVPYEDETGRRFGVVQGDDFLTPPVQISWADSKIGFVAEIVPSRATDHGWFSYSIPVFEPSNIYAGNFEYPFAFYDLDGNLDGVPELLVRTESSPPYDPHYANGGFGLPLSMIRYSWKQEDSGHWDYSVNLLGTHSSQLMDVYIDRDIIFKIIPYESFPPWVMERRWEVATFVEAMNGFASQEGIYAGSALNEVRDYFAMGENDRGNDKPPLEDLLNFEPLYRVEYNFEGDISPLLYMSPIDRQLHLYGAQGGLWRVNGNDIIEYSNLDSGYLDTWRHEIDGRFVEELSILNDYVLYTRPGRIEIHKAIIKPALFTVTPPINHSEWTNLGKLLKANDSSGMMPDFENFVQELNAPYSFIEGASISDLRIVEDEFRFVLSLSKYPQISGTGLLDISGLDPGDYLVTSSDDTFAFTPLIPAQLELLARQFDGTSLATSVQVSTSNNGAADALNMTLVVEIVSTDDHITEVVREPIDALAGETMAALVTIPSNTPAGSALTARLEDATGTVVAEAAPLSLTGAPPAGRVGVFDIGRAPVLWPVVGAFAALLAAAGLMAVRRREETP